ncbi:MAG: hypothetical protein IPG04_38600 [Polyangiaceae bacterium]|nr:hypothetical protein [Polyangiaceae bacterium]
MRAWLPYVVSLSFALAACGDSEGTGASSQTGGGGQAQGAKPRAAAVARSRAALRRGSSGEGGSGGGFVPMTCNEPRERRRAGDRDGERRRAPAMTGGAITRGHVRS